MNFLNTISESMEMAFVQRALYVALVVGFTNGALGSYIVLRRSALIVGSLSHSLLPGIALSVLVVGFHPLGAFLGALFAALLVGLGALITERAARLDGNTTLAIFYTFAFAGGLLLIDRMSTSVELEHWLFGNIIGLADHDIVTVLVVCGVVLVVLTLLRRPLVLTIFDPQVAISQGVPVGRLNVVLMVLFALGLVASLQAIGCILSISLLIAPAAIVALFARSPRTLFWFGGLLGGGIAAIAVLLSLALDIRTGALIVILLSLVFFVCLLVKIVFVRLFVHPRHKGDNAAVRS